MEERLNEILERLGALEQRLDRLERRGDERDDAREHRAGGERGCPFREEERRIVDLIVGLTAAHVEEAIDARMEGGRPPPRDGYGRHRHHGSPHDDHGHHDHGPRRPRHDHGGHGPRPGYGPPTGGPPGSWGGPPPPPPGWRGWPHGDR